MRLSGTHENLQRQTEDRRPSERSFAAVWTIVLLLLGLVPLVHGLPPRWWMLGIAGVTAITGAARPSLLAWPNRIWFQFGLLLGRVVNPVVTAVIFFFVFTPMGLVLRLLRKDSLRLRWDPDAASYWIPRNPPGPPPESMPNQF